MRFKIYAVLNKSNEVIANYIHDFAAHGEAKMEYQIFEFYHGIDLISQEEVTLSLDEDLLIQAKSCPLCCEREGIITHKRIKK